uniref:Uncharacterized protein n=1 Tax=Strongyloides stercoralis TaxID=6248 RepID=A0A0K0ENH2_STRER
MLSNSSENLDYQLLLNVLSSKKEMNNNHKIIYNKVERLYQEFVILYNNDQKKDFYKWIESGNEKKFDRMETFVNLMLPKLIDEKFRYVFELPNEINIPENVIKTVTKKMLQMFTKDSNKNTDNNMVILIDEENISINDKTFDYLKNMKKEILLCDDENIKLTDNQIYTNTDNIDDASEKWCKIFAEKIYTDEEIYIKSLNTSSDRN